MSRTPKEAKDQHHLGTFKKYIDFLPQTLATSPKFLLIGKNLHWLFPHWKTHISKANSNFDISCFYATTAINNNVLAIFGAYKISSKLSGLALACVAQWIEHRSANQRVAALIPSQGICLGCGPGPQFWGCERQPHIDVSHSLFPSLPLSLKVNKWNLKKETI